MKHHHRTLPIELLVALLLSPATALAQAWNNDAMSMYDQKGLSSVRGFSSSAPKETIDPFSGNLMLHHQDLILPGPGGLDVVIQRIYNSKIHANYAAVATGNPAQVAAGMQFVWPSPVGLGWTMHFGRLVNPSTLPNDILPHSRYYESPDGAHHVLFDHCLGQTGPPCMATKGFDNLYWDNPASVWRMGLVDGRNLTFGHSASNAASDIVWYVTEMRDINGNSITIDYHSDTIPGVPGVRSEYRNFVKSIVDASGRVINFNYDEIAPNFARLTSLTFGARTFTYGYASQTPYNRAFLTMAQPPEGAPWRYAYDGLTTPACGGGMRHCELTSYTHANGAVYDYAYGEEIFWSSGQQMAVRAIVNRQIGGRAMVAGNWTHTYNRASGYTGGEHTVITRPDGSREVYTFFGIGSAQYNPSGAVWKAGTLLEKRIDDGLSPVTVLESTTYDWVPSRMLSAESWGSPWTGYDFGVYVPLLAQKTIQQGSLTYQTTTTAFTDYLEPRCVEEVGTAGTRSMWHDYQGFSRTITLSGNVYHFLDPSLVKRRWTRTQPFSPAECAPGATFGPGVVPANHDDDQQYVYDADGRLTEQYDNERKTVLTYTVKTGDVATRMVYRKLGGTQPTNSWHDEVCANYDDYIYGVAQIVGEGARGACNDPMYTTMRDVQSDGSISAIHEPSGAKTSFTYDGLGRLVRVSGPGVAKDILAVYDGTSNLPSTLRRVMQAGVWAESRFDGAGREVEQENAEGVFRRRDFDAMGRVVFQSAPADTISTGDGDSYQYDALGRPTRITHADQTFVEYVYGTTEQTVEVIDELQRSTILRYESYGDPGTQSLIRVRRPGEASPGMDQYDYTVTGRLSLAQRGTRERRIDYTTLGQIRSEFHPEDGSTYYRWNHDGNLLCWDTDPTKCPPLSQPVPDINATNWYRYDRMGRTTSERYRARPGLPVPRESNFEYHTWINKMSRAVDDFKDHHFDYFEDGRISSETVAVGSATYVTSYAYDATGNLHRLTYPSGRSVTYQYDDANRLTSISGFVSNITYHPAGRMETMTRANGLTSSLTLDPRNRPDRLRVDGGTLLDLDYGYDAVGNVTSIVDRVDTNRNVVLGYDSLDQLTTASGPWGTMSFPSYNSHGDRMAETLNGSSRTFTVPEPTSLGASGGKLTSVIGSDTTQYQYDGGFLSARIHGTQVGSDEERFFFDGARQLRRLEHHVGGTLATETMYEYDGLKRRVLSTRPSACGASTLVNHYAADGARLAESTLDGLMVREYVVASGQTIAEIDVFAVGVDQATLDFGAVPRGASVTVDLVVTNSGNVGTAVDQLITSNGTFTPVGTTPVTLPAQSSTVIPVAFNTANLGMEAGTLTFCVSGVALATPVTGEVVAEQRNSPSASRYVVRLSLPGPVDPASVNAQTVVVHGMQTGVRTGTFSVVGNGIEFTPATPFRAGERVFVTVTSGVMLTSGGPVAPDVLEFTAAAVGSGSFVADAADIDLGTHDPGLRMGDLDNDGALDLFVGVSRFAPCADSRVWINGVGLTSIAGSGGACAADLALGDVDHDGDLDAVVSRLAIGGGA